MSTIAIDDSIDVHSVLLAQDVRQEVSGLHFIVGLLPSRMTSGTKPLFMPSIQCRIEYTAKQKIDHQKYILEIVNPSGSLHSRPEFDFSADANTSGMAIMQLAPVILPESGIYKFKFGKKDGELKDIYDLGVAFVAEDGPRD